MGSHRAFGDGEKLVYAVSYKVSFVNTDVAEVSFLTNFNSSKGTPVYRIEANGKTYPFYKWFFDLNDTYTSTLDSATLRPLELKTELKEGKYRYSSRFHYDWENKKVHTAYRNHKNPDSTYKSMKLTEGSYDAVALFFNLRCADLSQIEAAGGSGSMKLVLEDTIRQHPDAKAVFVNNPTYYGICSDLRAIVRMAHDAGMLCLADEAHGTHFYFGGGLPVSAMAAGADMAAVSMHKSGGSLTQSSLLLTGPNVHAGYVRQIINLTQTTSGSYLLMSSLDISRRNLALRGRQVFHQVADMAEYAREEINAVGGYYAFGKELCNGNSVFDFDTTKLSVHTLDIGLAGIEVYDILRDEYDIQIEFGDIGNILAYLSIGDRPQEVERLVSALAEIKRRYHTDGAGLLSQEYIDPEVAASPQEAFYAPKKSLPLRETEGMVCSEFVMCYPPGIPILAPGERITAEILDYIEYAKAKGCSMTGPEDPDILRLNVLA